MQIPGQSDPDLFYEEMPKCAWCGDQLRDGKIMEAATELFGYKGYCSLECSNEARYTQSIADDATKPYTSLKKAQ